MKIILFLSALLLAQSASAQTFTQVTTIPWDGVYRSTFAVNLAKATSLPSTLFLVGWGDVWPTIIDDAGDTWEDIVDPVSGQKVGGIWYAQCRGRANTVTIQFPSPSRFYGILGEKGGYLDVDVLSFMTTGNSNISQSATITTASADFIIGYGWNQTTHTPSLIPGTGYVMEGQAGIFLEDLQQTAPGPVSSSVTYGNGWAGWWVQGIVAFKPAIPNFCICSH